MSVNESASTSISSSTKLVRIAQPIAVLTSAFLAYVFYTEGPVWMGVSFSVFAAWNLFEIVQDLRIRRRRAE